MRQAKKIKTRQFKILQDMTTEYKTRQDKTIQNDRIEGTMRTYKIRHVKAAYYKTR